MMRHVLHVLVVGIVADAAFVTTAHAQIPAGVTLTPGVHVRVTSASDGGRRRGNLVSHDADTLRIQRDAMVHAYAFPNIARLEVRGGRDRRRGFQRGALILGGAGLVFGGIDVAQGKLGTADYLVTIVTNALIGGALGLLWSPRGWREIPLQSASAAPR